LFSLTIRATWVQADPPTDPLVVGRFTADEVINVLEKGVLFPERAIATADLPSPVFYPSEVVIPGTPPGSIGIIAYVPDPANPARAAIGTALVQLDDMGRIIANEGLTDHVAVTIVGEVALQP
jgi:hypothetical protein